MHKQKQLTPLLLSSLIGVSLLVVGCSSPQERRQANRDFDYLDSKLSTHPFTVPASLSTPAFSAEYKVPAISDAATKGAKGADVDVRPPAQLLTLIPGSRAEIDGDAMTVWITARSINQAIDNDLWQELTGFLGRRGIAMANVDAAGRAIETASFEATSQLDPWTKQAEDNDAVQVRQRYRVSLKKDPERHRAGLTATLLQHEVLNGDDKGNTQISQFDQRRYSAAFLNQIMQDYDNQLRGGNIALDANRVQMSLGADGNDLTAWLINAPFDVSWKRMSSLLPTLRFTITSQSESQGLIVVDYNEPDADYWKEKDLEPFGLDSGTYRLQFGEFKGQTAITLFDKDKKPVPASVVSKMFIGLSKAFSRQAAVSKK